MAMIYNGKRFSESKYKNEKEFEGEVVASSKVFFGKNTVFINAKEKVEAKELGGAIPDGFFFDFADTHDPQFYIVEIELSEHSFYNHIFPQITKFFAFLKNPKSQTSLIDKLFSTINTDEILKGEFKKYLGEVEIHKCLSDIIQSSQNILLVTNGPINELREIMDTYTDTWGKLVRCIEIRRFAAGDESIHSVTPDFETLQYPEPLGPDGEKKHGEGPQQYSEEYHLEGVMPVVKEIYAKIKDIVTKAGLGLNPQQYYISIKAGKNIAFIEFRVKKIRFIPLMPEAEIRNLVSHYHVASLSQSVQNFYNAPCAAVNFDNLLHVEELEKLITKLVESHRNN